VECLATLEGTRLGCSQWPIQSGRELTEAAAPYSGPEFFL